MSLFTADLRCKIVQKIVYKKVYTGHRPNSFQPWKEPGETTFENGMIMKNDISYESKYPNGFFDLWLPDSSAEKKPVFVYFHGGGFIFGDKSTGDPLAQGEGDKGKMAAIVKAGYALVNADYALSPDYRFPVQLEQVDELMRYLLTNADKLGIDMSRVCLSGASAGADLTELYASMICNREYAAEIGINPVMTEENLKVLAIDEATLDIRDFDCNKNMYAMLHCWLGDGSKEYSGKRKLLNAKDHIKEHFIPSWINSSNMEEWFIKEAHNLAKKLDYIDCDYDLVYFPREYGDLTHGYMEQLESSECAKQAFDRMMKFVGEHI